MPTIYSTIVAALQDLVNVNSRRLQQSCFSFVTSDISEFPRSIIELFYGAQIVAEEDCFAPIFRQHKNQRTDF